MNRFSELLAVFENAESNRSIDITGARRETVIAALRMASGEELSALIIHADGNERKIVYRLVTDLLAVPGMTLSVNDGEEITVKRSNDPEAIFSALSTTGEDYLIVHELGKTNRWVRLIWGNGVDVISDYHTSLETYLAAANKLANELDEPKF